MTFGLTAGNYQIASGDLPDSPVFSDFGDNSNLFFSHNIHDPQQTWVFTPTDNEREISIQNLSGGYIVCGDKPGSLCFPGDYEEIYKVKQVSDNGYDLVSKKTGYSLSADGQDLKLAEYTSGNSEEAFILAPTD
ncbi:hypothetical protein BDV33DRAFT_199044 [Aspergillus novoparasiticus]|uniref:Ricin B lectin domain-containing protein n=1 Tax=Aspergillus novoparasiticus TaxID=986946 RepID=A0A5N6F6E2_9EURO|nr:hypothetical protein BDV33DRAFT_199044 [Aspergillus novoparasiticus]